MSYGQSILKEYLSLTVAHPFLENHRPDWLFGMELDFYFPDIHLAVEFQGDQHFIDTERFGSSYSQRQRDIRKRQLCMDRGIALVRFNAIDLQFHRVRGLLKYGFRLMREANRGKRLFRAGVFHKSNKHLWKALSQKAIEYRQTLKRSFDSPTACRKGKSRGKAMKRAQQRYAALEEAAHTIDWLNTGSGGGEFAAHRSPS